MGYDPRVAMLAYSTFGHPPGERSERIQEAVKILDKRRVDFEYDGEMAADVALNPRLMQQYPFCRLSGPANVLIMPAYHSASIATKMLQELGGSTVIGPLLVGLNKPIQIVSLNAKDSDIVNMAAIASYNAGSSNSEQRVANSEKEKQPFLFAIRPTHHPPPAVATALSTRRRWPVCVRLRLPRVVPPRRIPAPRSSCRAG